MKNTLTINRNHTFEHANQYHKKNTFILIKRVDPIIQNPFSFQSQIGFEN
jgi:hypothetical protein